MAGMLRVSRSRGALSGVLLILLGIWGGLIPFVGPYVHFAYTPTVAWAYTSSRFWLNILPAVGTIVGGFIVLSSRLRPATLLGAWLAALSGCWFAVGNLIAPLVDPTMTPGLPAGGAVHRAVEQIGFFTGLGVVIVFVSAVALGRLSVLAMRDVTAAAAPEPAVTPATEVPETAAGAGAGAAAEAASRPRVQSTPMTRVFPSRSGQGPRRFGRRGTQPGSPTPDNAPQEASSSANR